MATPDQLNRFLFEHKHVRGELVNLSATLAEITQNHDYPEPVKALLGELLAATCLLTATLKFDGDISVQLQGDGPVSYMVINGNDKQQMRGIAKVIGNVNKGGVANLIGKGTMVITITPKEGKKYQGIVSLDKATLADCLAEYFINSEQIPTKLWLFCHAKAEQCGGALIQLLPDSGSIEEQQQDFEHICHLTDTLRADELFGLETGQILYRLFHEEDVRLFEPQEVNFVCGCSEEKCLTAIHNIPKEELTAHLAEEGSVKITCEFCLTTYEFDEQSLTHG